MIRGLLSDLEGEGPSTLIVALTWEDMAMLFTGNVMEIDTAADPRDGGMGLEGGPRLAMFAAPTDELVDSMIRPLVDRSISVEIIDLD